MCLRGLTRNAMTGRKKDTRLMCVVIALAFVFIVASSIILSSISLTEQTQRSEIYGK